MKKLDVLLMVLSCLFPVAGVMKYMSLELSLFIGGLLFLTSVGSYYAKRWHSRIFSWIAYTGFVTFLLAIWDQYATMISITANVKIAACVAIIPLAFRFRTYAITTGLLGLWAILLWDIKEMQSLAVLQRVMNVFKTEPLYLIIFVAAFLLGGWLARAFHRGKNKEKQEKPSLFKQKKKPFKPTFKLPIPSLPKLKLKMLNFSKTSSKANEQRRYEPIQEEQTTAFYTDIEPQHHELEFKPEPIQGETRMERRRNRLKA
ncbi:DUF3959 family protein [Bacillus sp. FJAT-42315]|uniref:DUF3959 family protein n=1 Tax=Bacillus sp. FJAT-42315 TaxID=2014077 RepID=UPI000C23EF1E|nr:DUF3959 family protein [Bacillus sp. FJAT-42315]